MNFFIPSDLPGLQEHSEGSSVFHGHQVVLILMVEQMAAGTADGLGADLAKLFEPASVGNNFCYCK